MAIRVRWVEGTPIALCAAVTNTEPDDIYLDDAVHEALASKFAVDWQSNGLLQHDLADPKKRRMMDEIEAD